MSTTGEEKHAKPSPFADPRFERLLTIGREMNDLRTKIHAATNYIVDGKETRDVEDVEFAREELLRGLDKDFDEAGELMPVVEEIITKYQEQIHSLSKMRKLNQGMAKIENITGSVDRSKHFDEIAALEASQINQLRSLVSALDSFEKDLSSRQKESVRCPRCSSCRVVYEILPSDMGYTLYKCDECSNAWIITQFIIGV